MSELLNSTSISGIVIQSTLSFIIIVLGVVLFRILYRKRATFPYNNANPFWILAILLFAIVIQIFNLLFYILIIRNNSNDDGGIITFIKLRKVNVLLINFFLFIAVIARLFSIKCCIKFNYDKLMTQIGSKEYKDNNSEHTGNRRLFSRSFYTRRFTYFKSFLVTYILFFLFFFVYYSIMIDSKSGVIDTLITFIYKEDRITDEAVSYTDIFVPYILYTVAFVLITKFIADIMKFPIKADKFKFKLEMFTLYILLFLFFNVKVLVLMFTKPINKELIYIIDSLLPLSIIAFYYYLTYKRRISFKDINVNDIVENFDEFTHRDITFQLFYAYVEANSRHHIGFLSFLADYYIYKEIVDKLNQERKGTFNQQHKMNIDKLEFNLGKKGKEIYKDYFKSIDSSDDLTVTSGFISKNDKSDINIIDIHFPIDILEKVKEAYDTNFEQDNVETIYDEPFSWVRGELIKVFDKFKEQEDEMNKLERIMFYVNIFEISEER